MDKALNLFMIAGELSGDRLGAALIDGLRSETKDSVSVRGVGGPMMAASGMDSLFDMSDLSVMGLVEVLPRIPKLLYRVRQTANAVIQAKPDALITIDSPDFCFRVVERVKKELPNLKVIHYVAPSVWAWRPERGAKMAKHVDHVLALLPFEPPYMTAEGMSCDFVGHPVISEPAVTPAHEQAFCEEFNIHGKGPIITLLPGSRKGEITRMAPIFGTVMQQILDVVPTAQFILPLASSVVSSVQKAVGKWPVQPILLVPSRDIVATEERKRTAYAISELAIATSGTVALELAAQNTPMIVAYKANWATTRMVKKLAQIDTANLINIITDTRVVPEFLFENCDATQISHAALSILNTQTGSVAQKDAMKDAMLQLGKGQKNTHLWAAQSVLTAIS